jgi:hypothetical protein
MKHYRLAVLARSSNLGYDRHWLLIYLVDVLVFSTVDMSLANASVTLRLGVDISSLEVVSSYNSGSTPCSIKQQSVTVSCVAYSVSHNQQQYSVNIWAFYNYKTTLQHCDIMFILKITHSTFWNIYKTGKNLKLQFGIHLSLSSRSLPNTFKISALSRKLPQFAFTCDASCVL